MPLAPTFLKTISGLILLLALCLKNIFGKNLPLAPNILKKMFAA
jgi:hypothetical protein